MLRRTRRRGRGGAAHADETAAATVKVRLLLDDFIYDLAALMAGLEPELTYLEPGAAATLLDALRPFRETGYRLDPDFGDHASATVAGLDEGGQVRADVTIVDQSVMVDPFDRRLGAARATWELTVFISGDLARIEAATFRGRQAKTAI